MSVFDVLWAGVFIFVIRILRTSNIVSMQI